MTRLKTIFLIFSLNCSVCIADYFSAPIQKADWEFNGGPSYCQLKQQIPLYGQTDFMQHSGELLRFSVREERFKPKIVKASLTINTSPWIHQSIAVKDYLVHLDSAIDSQSHPQLSVYGESAEIMLDALSNGFYPTFTYARASINGLSPETHVAASSINFATNYDQFVECRKDFLPHDLKNELEKSLFFNPGSKSLSTDVMSRLQVTAKYAKGVKGSQVVIVSDTAIAGFRDKRWFLNRAKTIADKLAELGVPKEQVQIKSGRYFSIANNKTIQLNVYGPDALKAIYYKKGNTQLTLNEKQRLDLLIRYTEEFRPQSQLVIRSHTDNKGSRANNLKVSQQRGDEIRNYIVSKGIDEQKVQVKAYGESKPAKSNRFPKGRAQNRRAIIDFIG